MKKNNLPFDGFDEKELQKLIKEALLENPELFVLLMERIPGTSRYWPWEKEADVVGTLKDLPKDIEDTVKRSETYKTAKKAVQGAGEVAKKVGKGAKALGKGVKDMAVDAKDWTYKTKGDIGRAVDHLYTHGDGDIFSPPPHSAAAMKDTGVERGTGERYRIPYHIAHRVWKQQAEKDFFQGLWWSKESADFQTPEEYQEKTDELLTRYVGAPAAAAVAATATAALAALGGGSATAYVTGKLAPSAGPGAAAAAKAGFGKLLGFHPAFSLVQKGAAAAGMSAGKAKVVGWVTFALMEGTAIYEYLSCEDGFHIYDDVLKLIDPFNYIAAALQRSWPGGDTGQMGTSTTFGGEVDWDSEGTIKDRLAAFKRACKDGDKGACADYKKLMKAAILGNYRKKENTDSDYGSTLARPRRSLGGRVDWNSEESVTNALRIVSLSLMNEEDRETVNMLHGTIYSKAKKLEQLEGRKEMCPQIIKLFKEMHGAKEALQRITDDALSAINDKDLRAKKAKEDRWDAEEPTRWWREKGKKTIGGN